MKKEPPERVNLVRRFCAVHLSDCSLAFRKACWICCDVYVPQYTLCFHDGCDLVCASELIHCVRAMSQFQLPTNWTVGFCAIPLSFSSPPPCHNNSIHLIGREGYAKLYAAESKDSTDTRRETQDRAGPKRAGHRAGRAGAACPLEGALRAERCSTSGRRGTRWRPVQGLQSARAVLPPPDIRSAF